MEIYITIAAVCICVTFFGVFTLIKACDWLIGLKYKTKEDCSITRHSWDSKLKSDFASRETVEFLKDDVEEMKDKINDIHKVVMSIAIQQKDDK